MSGCSPSLLTATARRSTFGVPEFVFLYVDPPAHAVVMSVDEKSQIQALDRTQPGLPLKSGRCATMTHMWTAASPQAFSANV